MIQRKSRVDWEAERHIHRKRLLPRVNERLRRGHAGEKHPVYDFLFEYYSFRPAHLLRYSPGIGVLLEDGSKDELDWPSYYSEQGNGIVIKPGAFPLRRLPTLLWGVRFLATTAQRQPMFHCLGLHEWAMVYRAEEVRHSRVPLRMSNQELVRFVESQNLCCSHFDAYRFFTPQAVPLNRYRLDRYSLLDHDQPGCIHANMDLYKWAFLIAPFTPGSLIADAFDLAWQAREIDMRASPYDLASFGFVSIAIETKAGREEYIAHQRRLYEMAMPIREQLLEAYIEIEKLVTSYAGTLGAFSNGTRSWSPHDSAASMGSR